MRIVITEFMDEAAVVALAERFDVCYDKDLVDRPEALPVQLADADGLIVRNRTPVDASLLAYAPRLRVVGRLGVGLDNIDVNACASRGIAVISATGANALAVAIPCHRVVRNDGGLSGYRWGVERKRRLLAVERDAISGNSHNKP